MARLGQKQKAQTRTIETRIRISLQEGIKKKRKNNLRNACFYTTIREHTHDDDVLVIIYFKRKFYFFNNKNRLGLVSLANSVASSRLAMVKSIQSSLNWFSVSV